MISRSEILGFLKSNFSRARKLNIEEKKFLIVDGIILRSRCIILVLELEIFKKVHSDLVNAELRF